MSAPLCTGCAAVSMDGMPTRHAPSCVRPGVMVMGKLVRQCGACHCFIYQVEDHHGWCVEGLREVARTHDDPSPAAQLAPLPDGLHSPDDLAAREDAIRSACAAWALQWAGLVANPTAGDDAYARYCDLIAPGETDARAEAMATMSGCGLFVRAYLRAVLRDTPQRLIDGYKLGRAISDIDGIADVAGAVTNMPTTPPRVGDIVRVYAPEHVFVCTKVTPREDGGYDVESVDGGQRAPGGWEAIESRSRVLTVTARGMLDHVNGSMGTRLVMSRYDLGAMLRVYGCAEEMCPDG